MEQTAESKKPDEKPDHNLTITISTADEDREFTFRQTTKVADVKAAAVTSFGLDPAGVYTLALAATPSEKLEDQRPLVSYGIKDGDKLLLSSKAGGV